MAETTTVWIAPHDDAAIGYIVNERDDMYGNWEDLRDEGFDGGLTFDEYLASWQSIEMPYGVLNGPAEMRIAWIEVELGLI